MLTIEIKRDTPHRFTQWTTIGNISHKYHGKAYTRWYNNGQKYSEEYWVNGEYHRNPTLGSAITVWHRNGQKSSEVYWVNGEYHRNPLEGPAVTRWNTNGQKSSEGYWVNGERHLRDTG